MIHYCIRGNYELTDWFRLITNCVVNCAQIDSLKLPKMAKKSGLRLSNWLQPVVDWLLFKECDYCPILQMRYVDLNLKII